MNIKESDIKSVSLILYINKVWECVEVFLTIEDLISAIYKMDDKENTLIASIVDKSRFVYQNYYNGIYLKFDLIYNSENFDSTHIIFNFDDDVEIDEMTLHIMLLKYIRIYKLNKLI